MSVVIVLSKINKSGRLVEGTEEAGETRQCITIAPDATALIWDLRNDKVVLGILVPFAAF
jgi:hypothetical protein